MSSVKFHQSLKCKSPERGTSGSAGIDIFIPEFTLDFIREFKDLNSDTRSMAFLDEPKDLICIYPQGRVMIPTGLKVSMPEGSALIAMNKSGVSWKDRVTLLASVVDYDYQGRIFITMHNYSAYNTTLLPNQKLTQLVRVPVFFDSWVSTDEDKLYVKESKRGAGALGSTGA